MDKKYDREQIKFHLYPDKTFHLEFIFDSPLPYKTNYQGKNLESNQYSFLDLDDKDGKQYTYFASTGSKVDQKLITHQRGDRIDLTARQGVNKVGKPITWYDVYDYGTTPETGSRRQFDPIPDPNYTFPNQQPQRSPDGLVQPRDIPQEDVADIDTKTLNDLF